ncbi:hypothetical protein IMY05_C2487000500 [Salix suchowensis]|nr:hypothetical protein IMY05_C2487000500 [Salix suchowensis]
MPTISAPISAQMQDPPLPQTGEAASYYHGGRLLNTGIRSFSYQFWIQVNFRHLRETNRMSVIKAIKATRTMKERFWDKYTSLGPYAVGKSVQNSTRFTTSRLQRGRLMPQNAEVIRPLIRIFKRAQLAFSRTSHGSPNELRSQPLVKLLVIRCQANWPTIGSHQQGFEFRSMQIRAHSLTPSAEATLYHLLYRTPDFAKVTSTGVPTLASLDLLRPDYHVLMQLWVARIFRGRNARFLR